MTPRGSLRRWKLAPLLTAVVLFAVSCAENAPQTSLEPKGSQAEKIDNLIDPIFIVAGVVFVLILGGALYIALKYRATDETDYDDFPDQVHGNFKLEIGWTIAPAIVLAVVGLFTVVNIFDLSKKPTQDAMRVEVIGQQWWWEYRYDLDNDGTFDEIITANDLVIPTDRDISLSIKSRDVIHSWWAPALNGKKDAVPGRTHPLMINAGETGEFIGQCSEFCGLSHAEMRIKVVALEQGEFDAWAENQQQPFENPLGESAQAGWAAFAGQCTSCHRLTGMTDPGSADNPGDATEIFTYDEEINQVSGAAPNLANFMTRSTFAGAKFNLRKETPECEALGPDWAQTQEGLDMCFNRNDLEAWLRNSPAEKAMYPGDAPAPDSRGMPNLNLTEDQIDDLVTFLTTLK